MIYKISNFNMWTAKHFAKASCTELTLIRKHNSKTNSEFKRFFKQSDHFEKEITNKHTMLIAKKL